VTESRPAFVFIFDDELPAAPTDWLVDGVLQPGRFAVLFGPPGAGKSIAAIDLALSVATGVPWLGRYTVRQAPVAYCYTEGSDGFRVRVDAWKQRHGVIDRAGVVVTFEAPNLLEKANVTALLSALRRLDPPPALLIVDTLARVIPGADENSAKDMGTAIAACDRLRTSLNCAVLLVHHTRRDGANERGSTALRGAADTMLAVTVADDIVTLACDKQRDAAPFDSLRLRLLEVGSSVVLVPSDASPQPGRLTSRARVMLVALVELCDAYKPPTFTQWLAAVDCPKGTFPKSTFIGCLKTLKAGDWVTQQPGKSTFIATDKGRAAVGPDQTNSGPIGPTGPRSKGPDQTNTPRGVGPGPTLGPKASGPDERASTVRGRAEPSEQSDPSERSELCGCGDPAVAWSAAGGWCSRCWAVRCQA
jgi:hypothetical protein